MVVNQERIVLSSAPPERTSTSTETGRYGVMHAHILYISESHVHTIIIRSTYAKKKASLILPQSGPGLDQARGSS